MKIFKNIFFVSLFLLNFSCSNYVRDSSIDVYISNNIRSIGTYYIVDADNIEEPLSDILEESIDNNLASYGFIRLKDKTSQQTANYLVFIDLKDKDDHLKTFKVLILDNTANHLKKVFLGEFYFKKDNSYGNIYLILCGIKSIFENKKLGNNSVSFSNIETTNKVVDCLEYSQ